MGDRTCARCGKVFAAPCRLAAHQRRKTPCDPIVEPPNDARKAHTCRYCGRGFTTTQALARHTKQNCKIANSEEGMEKLMEHTLQKQMGEMRAENAEMKAQLAELTALLKSQLALDGGARRPPISTIGTNVEHANTVNTGPVTNVTQINLRSWSSEERILIPASLVRAAFTENGRLIEYCRLSDEEKVDAERAAPYVVEALVDLVKRAHAADPASRNVYLNPKRADQVMVYDESWKVLTLVEAIRALFDSVAGRIHEIMVTDQERARLPFEVQASASWIPNLYEDEPEKYVAQAKAPMSAHLTNNHAAAATPLKTLAAGKTA